MHRAGSQGRRSGSHRSEAAARDGGGYGGGGGGSAARSAYAPADPPAIRPSGGWSGRQGPRRGPEPLLGRRRCNLPIASCERKRARAGARHEACRALPEARWRGAYFTPSWASRARAQRPQSRLRGEELGSARGSAYWLNFTSTSPALLSTLPRPHEPHLTARAAPSRPGSMPSASERNSGWPIFALSSVCRRVPKTARDAPMAKRSTHR